MADPILQRKLSEIKRLSGRSASKISDRLSLPGCAPRVLTQNAVDVGFQSDLSSNPSGVG
jgi:hypothetical protein